MVGHGSILSFTLSNLTGGIYTCSVSSPTWPAPLSRSARVSLRGLPSILPGRHLQYGALGGSVLLVCEAEATPPVESVVWSLEGLPVTGGPRHQLVETQQGAVVRSSLLLPQLTEAQLGEYTCSVTNALGRTATTRALRPVDGLPLVTMVAAAIGGLLLTLAAILVVVACRRMVHAPSRPQPDQVSTSSSLATKAATMSSLSAPDDLDGSDSLPEYHANYMATSHRGHQPDLVPSMASQAVLQPGWHGYGTNRDTYSTARDTYGTDRDTYGTDRNLYGTDRVKDLYGTATARDTFGTDTDYHYKRFGTINNELHNNFGFSHPE